MTAQNMLIAADGHLHWYPSYAAGAALRSLLGNLDTMALERNPGNMPVLNLGLLVEGAGLNSFERLRDGKIDCSSLDVETRASADGRGILFMRSGLCRLCLIAGRQVVSRERLEALGIGLTFQPDDGRPLSESIGQIVEGGGFPILPWSPGKWLFGRGEAVRTIIEHADPAELAIGDSSLRPRCFPEPGLMRLARDKGFVVVPGSDPLPLRGEERGMGSYGFLYEGPFDLGDPVASVFCILGGDPSLIRPAGARNSLPGIVLRLARLRALKRERL